ncbi:MAG: MFS transporter [Elusimicrobia bacterium]|nr:MFS transporter [Elusimicrobiota bacterium]
MLMLKALRDRSIRLLWSGQALSAIGDEIYRVALIWLAVGLIGADTGYLAAAQSGALLALCLVGGHWADRWDHRRTMIGVDAARALIVLAPVAAFYMGTVTLPLLFVVALSLSALSAFFEPALQATLPDVAPDTETLQAATGLMSTTVRLARAVGPAIVGLLAPFVPTIHFFTLDSASFWVSALSVARLAPSTRPARPLRPRPGFHESLLDGLRAAGRSPLMSDLMLVRALIGGFWNLSYGLGLALLARAMAPGDMRAFGWAVACYGAGNVGGALWAGNIRRRRPVALACVGYAFLGAGFLAMGLAPNLFWLGAACALGGFGGPVSDLPFVDLVQKLYPVEDIPKLFRLRMAAETGAALLLMTASPTLFRDYSPRIVMTACGAAFSLIAAVFYAARGETAAA